MKQTIVIAVSMPCEVRRSRARVLAAETAGVISISTIGDNVDNLEVVGNDVDIFYLVNRLRKKLGHAKILRVEEVKDKKQEKMTETKKPDQKKPDQKKQDEKKPPVDVHSMPQCCPSCYHHYCPPVPPMVMYDESSACSIM